MIQVDMRDNVNHKINNFPSDTTIREALEGSGISYARGVMMLDGSPLQPGDMDKSFAEMGVTGHCYLTSVVKTNNALAA